MTRQSLHDRSSGLYELYDSIVCSIRRGAEWRIALHMQSQPSDTDVDVGEVPGGEAMGGYLSSHFGKSAARPENDISFEVVSFSDHVRRRL